MLIISILSPLICEAQNLKVLKYELKETDLTAKAEKTRRVSKRDGKLAALIKIATKDKDYSFEFGTWGAVEDPDKTKPGEIWLYVRPETTTINIIHNTTGSSAVVRLNPPPKSGSTYELIIDPGTGKYCNIVSQLANSEVYLDNELIGKTPIYNQYIAYGEHKIKCVNVDARHEGSTSIVISKDSNNDETLLIDVPLQDQSMHYGKVTVTTMPDAEIYFNDQRMGIGEWHTELREGEYTVETKHENCDDTKTTFSVKPQTNNIVTAQAPKLHKGFVKLFVRPTNTKIFNDGHIVDPAEPISFPVGTQNFTFSHKGYISEERDYIIKHNVTEYDTIYLQRIQYLKSNAFYIGAAYTLGEISGITGSAGMLYKSVDVQISYTFGTNKTTPINLYTPGTYELKSQCTFTTNIFAVKAGYQFKLSTNLAFTGQLGFISKSLNANVKEGIESFSDGAYCNCASVGGKLIYTPMEHFCIFGAPEYDIEITSSSRFDEISKAANFNKGGFLCHLGVQIIF